MGTEAAPGRLLIVGNWKMQGLTADMAGVRSLASALANQPSDAAIVICPPATLLAACSQVLAGTPLACGGQTCHAEPQGAHTGEISAAMLKDAGADYVILGHSERRTACGETDAQVSAKALAAAGAGLEPIICVGETAAERDTGRTLSALRRQVGGSTPAELRDRRLAVAYEPVWAIGTGRTPAPGDIEAAHSAIRISLVSRLGAAAARLRILYGGSVTPDNAAEIAAIPEVGGLLVGRACLDWKAFLHIIQTAAAARARLRMPA